MHRTRLRLQALLQLAAGPFAALHRWLLLGQYREASLELVARVAGWVAARHGYAVTTHSYHSERGNEGKINPEKALRVPASRQRLSL